MPPSLYTTIPSTVLSLIPFYSAQTIFRTSRVGSRSALFLLSKSWRYRVRANLSAEETNSFPRRDAFGERRYPPPRCNRARPFSLPAFFSRFLRTRFIGPQEAPSLRSPRGVRLTAAVLFLPEKSRRDDSRAETLTRRLRIFANCKRAAGYYLEYSTPYLSRASVVRRTSLSDAYVFVYQKN